MRTPLLTAVLLVGVLAGTAFGQSRIKLTNGKSFDAIVEQEEADRIHVNTEFGRFWLDRKLVESIEKKADPVPEPARETGEEHPERKEVQAEKTRHEPAPGAEAEPGQAVEPAPADGAEAELDVDVAALARRLGSRKALERIAAADEVVAAWPASAPAVDLALHSENELAAIEASLLLDREELGDTQARLRVAMKSRSAAARLLAIRAVRHRKYVSLEPEAILLLQNDPMWKVQQEALRTLQDIGTKRCLRTLLSRLSMEEDEDEDRARRFWRVLRKLFGEDLGADLDVWREAIEDVHFGRRKLAADK